jgi:hypothetical protein
VSSEGGNANCVPASRCAAPGVPPSLETAAARCAVESAGAPAVNNGVDNGTDLSGLTSRPGESPTEPAVLRGRCFAAWSSPGTGWSSLGVVVDAICLNETVPSNAENSSAVRSPVRSPAIERDLNDRRGLVRSPAGTPAKGSTGGCRGSDVGGPEKKFDAAGATVWLGLAGIDCN